MPYKIPYIILKIRVITIITLSFYSLSSQAQIYNADQNPPSLKWKQINTPNFQIIYPEEFRKEGQRMAGELQWVIGKEAYSLGKMPRKISVILQNQGTSSNGFVQLGPRRSEFYTTPSQNFDYQDWLNTLVVHEMRHVVQFDKLTGSFRAPFFEKLALAIFGITLPPWFYEGDAVGMETALTHGGRGRIPEWSIAFRTNTLTGLKFSYSKDFFNSYKDFTPGYYQLGFFMNTRLRREHGTFITDSILSRISRNPLRPYSFSNAVKKFTGLNTRQLHDSTVAELREMWLHQLTETQVAAYPVINQRHTKIPQHYLMPVALPGHKFLALLNSKAYAPGIVEIDSAGHERTVVRIGPQETPWFSYNAGKIVWDEFRYDARFHQRSFNVINVFDLSDRRRHQLTHRSRLFAPALSPDGHTIIAVEVSYANQIALVELNTRTGKTVRRYSSPSNFMLQMPSFHANGAKVIVVAIARQGKTLLELDRKTGKFTALFPFLSQEILHPVYAGNQVLFKAHFNGIDNIYNFDPADGKIYQVSFAKIGAFNPSYDEISEQVIINTFSQKGYDISALNEWKKNRRSIGSIKNTFVDYAAPLYQQEGARSVFDTIPSQNYPEKPYHEFSNLFYFHSIVPIAEDNPFFDDSNLGLEFQSDNKLNTLSFYTRYQFNNYLRKSEYLTGFAYRRFLPVLSVDYTNRARLIYRRTAVNGQTVISPISWRENFLEAAVSLPLVINRFNHNYTFELKGGTSYTSRYDIANQIPSLLTSLHFPMHYQFYASRSSTRTSRDLAPRWGQSMTLRYQHFPFENRVQGELFSLKTSFFFPGLFANHSFQTSFNYQNGTGNFINSNDIPLISGYSQLKSVTNVRNTLLLDYRLPLFYPDWEIGPLAYVKRIKGGLFADFQNVGKGNSFSPKSYGAEFRGDMNLLRFYLPNFDVGGKIIFLNEKPRQNPIFEFMASYSF